MDENTVYRRHFKFYYAIIREKDLLKREINILYGLCDSFDNDRPMSKRYAALAERLRHLRSNVI